MAEFFMMFYMIAVFFLSILVKTYERAKYSFVLPLLAALVFSYWALFDTGNIYAHLFFAVFGYGVAFSNAKKAGLILSKTVV